MLSAALRVIGSDERRGPLERLALPGPDPRPVMAEAEHAPAVRIGTVVLLDLLGPVRERGRQVHAGRHA